MWKHKKIKENLKLSLVGLFFGMIQLSCEDIVCYRSVARETGGQAAAVAIAATTDAATSLAMPLVSLPPMPAQAMWLVTS